MVCIRARERIRDGITESSLLEGNIEKRWKTCVVTDINSYFKYVCLATGKFSCDFEQPLLPNGKVCAWSQDSSDHFNWTRNQGHTGSTGTGPTTDHTKGVGKFRIFLLQ